MKSDSVRRSCFLCLIVALKPSGFLSISALFLPPLITHFCIIDHTQPVSTRSRTEQCGPSERRGQSGAEIGRSWRAAEALAGDGDGNGDVLASMSSPGAGRDLRLLSLVLQKHPFLAVMHIPSDTFQEWKVCRPASVSFHCMLNCSHLRPVLTQMPLWGF